MAELRLERVGKRYRPAGPWVVRDVDLEAGSGQLVRVEGSNGSGKSTLLRVVAGVCAPNRGKVTGRPHTGFVPERFPAALPFTARDYLAHLGRVHGLRGAVLRRRTDDLLARFSITEQAGVQLRRMSKGTCQKVAVAQALVAQPGLLVFDEAWTGLDQAARQTLDDAIMQRLADGATVVFVDHDPARLAGREHLRWRLEQGRVTVSGGAARGAATSGATARGAAAGQPSRPGPAPDAVVIEFIGYPGDGPPLDRVPGVLGPAQCADPRPGAAALRAEAGSSDAVLRHLLAAGDAVHILGLRQAPAGGRQPGPEDLR